MFYTLTGTITHQEQGFLVLSCCGVGFKIQTTMHTMMQVQGQEQTTLFTHLNVKEDALDLFGFFDRQELSCFKMLLSVSGIGPKAAIAILCELSPEKFASCVASGDYKSITKAQGVGPKIAQRVILELKDKISKSGIDTSKSNAIPAHEAPSKEIEEAISALCVLGYSRQEAQGAVDIVAIRNGCDGVEDMIKLSLIELSKFK